MASKQGLYYYTKEEIDELLDSATSFKAGDTFNFMGNLTGVTGNATQNDVRYITLRFPKSISNIAVANISITYFGVSELERIGYNASRNTLNLLDSSDAAASINLTTCNVTFSKIDDYSLGLQLAPKTGYRWQSFQSYMTIHLRQPHIIFSFGS